jgi:predicted DsbA family dithiol-disulfide isomerase
MLKKFGPERLEANKARLSHIGQQEGIPFAFDGRIGDTKPSHILMHLAGLKGGSALQNKAAESLFKAHFEDAQDITKVDTLVDVAEQAGMDGTEVRNYLNDEKSLKAVIQEEQEGRQKEHINGVPHFVVNGKMVVGGAQGESEWIEVFSDLKEDA